MAERIPEYVQPWLAIFLDPQPGLDELDPFQHGLVRGNRLTIYQRSHRRVRIGLQNLCGIASADDDGQAAGKPSTSTPTPTPSTWLAIDAAAFGEACQQLGYTVEQPVYTSSYTAPAAFTVPVQIRAGGVSIAQWIYSLDTVTVAYISNTKRVDVKCLVYLGSRVVARGGKTDTYVNTGIRDSSSCEVNVGHAYAGKRLRLVGEVRAGGRLVRASRYFYGKRG